MFKCGHNTIIIGKINVWIIGLSWNIRCYNILTGEFDIFVGLKNIRQHSPPIGIIEAHIIFLNLVHQKARRIRQFECYQLFGVIKIINLIHCVVSKRIDICVTGDLKFLPYHVPVLGVENHCLIIIPTIVGIISILSSFWWYIKFEDNCVSRGCLFTSHVN